MLVKGAGNWKVLVADKFTPDPGTNPGVLTSRELLLLSEGAEARALALGECDFMCFLGVAQSARYFKRIAGIAGKNHHSGGIPTFAPRTGGAGNLWAAD